MNHRESPTARIIRYGTMGQDSKRRFYGTLAESLEVGEARKDRASGERPNTDTVKYETNRECGRSFGLISAVGLSL